MNPNTDNIYSDYEKIVPSEKLPQFLFDHFRSLKEVPWIKDVEEEASCQALQTSVQKYNKYRLPVNFLDRIFLKLYVKKNKKDPSGGSGQDKKNILFLSSRYSDIILETKKHHHVGLLVQGKLDRLFAAKNFIGYVNVNDLDQYVLAYLKEKNIKYLYWLIEEVENKLIAANPDYIVLCNDILPIESAVVLVSKKLGIATIEIQHGMYTESVMPTTTRSVVDHLLVWGEHFKDLYVRANIRKPEDVYILGYPSSIEKQYALQKKKNYTVCYLGENFSTFNKSSLKIELEFVDALSKICKKKALKFIYRPHPMDNRKLLEEKLPDIQFTSKKEKLKETFEKADIFISFISTALPEAAMRSKISLQLTNYPIDIYVPNYENLGVCNKTLKTFDELENYLAEIINASDLNKFKLNFNNDYVETRYNPGQRFLELIKEIEEKNFNKNK